MVVVRNEHFTNALAGTQIATSIVKSNLTLVASFPSFFLQIHSKE
jgi:hypothetical protein